MRERFGFWWEQHPAEWWFDFKGKLAQGWWQYQDKRRAKNPELVELDAFRALIGLEKQLEEWPRAIPLLEQALKLYDITKQPGKREAIRKRLEAEDATNRNVEAYCGIEEKKARQAATSKVAQMTDDQKQVLERARALIQETGHCSTAMLQRRMGISYNHAAELIEIIRAEMPSE